MIRFSSIALALLLTASYPQKTFKDQLEPSVLTQITVASPRALLVQLLCMPAESKIDARRAWQPCEDAKQLNPDKDGNLTVIFLGILSDGTSFRIAPIGKKP